jgi:choline-sulfatase
VIFTSDHGDMLGEYGLWYKMSFREWSCRIPVIVYNPGKLEPRRVSQPVAHVDILPTLIDIASELTGVDKPDPIDPLDGRSLWPLCLGDDSSDPDRAVSEYLAEGTGAPMLMIRKGYYKFIFCPTDPDQLFDLSQDPDEQHNLALDENQRDRISAFRAEADAHWNADELKHRIIENQVRRRRVHEALRIGDYHSWDYNPARDPAGEYTRSHMDLTRFDITSRFPRPPAFKPKYK